MTVPEVTFRIDGRADAPAIVAGLARGFHTQRGGRAVARRAYYDTFDWRLHRDGGALCADDRGGRRMLGWRMADGSMRHRLQVEAVPAFARDLDASPFRDDLARVIDVRRLLPVARVEVRSEQVAILDRREKTVARVFLERGTATEGDGPPRARPMADRLRVTAVRGYDRDHAAIVHHLEQTVGLKRHAGGEWLLALAALGIEPGGYSSKLDLTLEGRMRADEAAKRILHRLLETMRANEDGTRRDLDVEFLHDFRVAVRRARSCLGQIKGLFDAEPTAWLRDELAWLGGVTGPTRDLDVYLLNLREYRRELPASLEADLDALDSHLRQRQAAEQREVARALDSRRYTDLVEGWAALLDRPACGDAALAPNAARPVRDVAAERIRRAFQRVRRRSRGLDRTTPPQTLHRIRIDCKKLRYLLEFFRSVFDASKVAPFVGTLKQLQDHLGEFNDLNVQRRELRGTAAEMLEGGVAGAGTLLAMGYLVGKLEARQADRKDLLLESVGRFVREPNRTALRELLR